MTLFVAKIHNNSLGSCQEVSSYEEGIDLIREMAEEQLGRPLEDEENECLINEYEVYNDEDADNVYTWSIGALD